MSFSLQSVPLQTISTINIETIQGDDELYFVTTTVYNPITKQFETFPLSLTSKIEFSIKSIISGELLYHTDDDSDGVGDPPYYANNITKTDPENGKFVMEIPRVVSETIGPGTYRYDIQITKTDDKRKTIAIGTILFVDDVTP